MRVLVIGSTFGEKATQEACEALGAELAKAHSRILVGSAYKTSADLYVVRGAASHGKVNIEINRVRNSEIGEPEDARPFADLELKHTKLKFEHNLHEGSWISAHLAGMLRADVVLVIAGGEFAKAAGYNAVLLGKPLLALPAFGHSGKELFEEFRRDYLRISLPNDDWNAVFGSWDRERSPAAVVSVIRALLTNNPFGRQQPSLLPFVSLGAFLPLLIWAVFEYVGYKNSIPPMFSLLAITFAGAVLGTTLRTCRALQQTSSDGSSPFPSRESFLRDVIAGTIIAFIFVILFFYVGTVATAGKPPALNDPATFPGLSIIAMVLSFTSGFMQEAAVKTLQDRLATVLSKGSK